MIFLSIMRVRVQGTAVFQNLWKIGRSRRTDRNRALPGFACDEFNDGPVIVIDGEHIIR